MAMRTEQHGNLFAKLNNVNLSDGAVRNRRCGQEGRAKGRSQAGTLCRTSSRAVWSAKLTKQLAVSPTKWRDA
jgi:hypothetical protein